MYTKCCYPLKALYMLQVNNAYTGVNAIISNLGKKFWEMPDDHWDVINEVGLRGHFMCSMRGARFASLIYSCSLVSFYAFSIAL